MAALGLLRVPEVWGPEQSAQELVNSGVGVFLQQDSGNSRGGQAGCSKVVGAGG